MTGSAPKRLWYVPTSVPEYGTAGFNGNNSTTTLGDVAITRIRVLSASSASVLRQVNQVSHWQQWNISRQTDTWVAYLNVLVNVGETSDMCKASCANDKQ